MSRLIKHSLATLISVAVLLSLTWISGRAALSSLLTVYAARTKNIAAASSAVGLRSSSADAHRVRAAILEDFSDVAGAVAAHTQAVAARPDQCELWLNLARMKEFSGDRQGAIAAARQAVLLAPHYGAPHWQLGNILLRAGQRDEAFSELRQAGKSNPVLMFGIVDLAWRVSGGNVEFVKQAIQPSSPDVFLLVGRYLRSRGELDGALAMFSSAGTIPTREISYTITALINAKKFRQAHAMWSRWREAGPGLVDPGFEKEADLNEPGFGWRIASDATKFNLSLDPVNPRQGQSSLKVDFKGDSDPSAPVVSQLFLVEPGKRYQVRFSIRTEEIVSGGMPKVIVVDATDSQHLGQSEEFPATTSNWRDYSIEFSTGANAQAAQLNLQRRTCIQPPCPIFGRLWLDNVSLHQL